MCGDAVPRQEHALLPDDGHSGPLGVLEHRVEAGLQTGGEVGASQHTNGDAEDASRDISNLARNGGGTMFGAGVGVQVQLDEGSTSALASRDLGQVYGR